MTPRREGLEMLKGLGGGGGSERLKARVLGNKFVGNGDA